MDQVIEIRTYTLKADMVEQFRHIVLTQSLPMLLAAGTDVVAMRPSLHSPDSYLLIRAYANLAQRNRQQDEFYGGAAWAQGPRDAVMACIESYSTVVIETDRSVIDSLRHLPLLT